MCTFIEMDDKGITKLFNNGDEVGKLIKISILKQESFVNLLKKWKVPSMQKLTTILEPIFQNDLPEDVRKNFFLAEVIPNMMSLEIEATIRDELIDVALMLCNIVPASELSPKDYEIFLKEVYSKYIPAISQLRDSNYHNWHRLWIFLVRFCAKKIHNSMDLTNRLLRIVEYAFRNSSHEQRLKGYDCWKELIDNASLDHCHMSTSKQIKLLVTPLKAKFSKQEVVICKRFDVFVHLLKKLQKKAVLCLPEFLEFCFGPIGDNKDSSRSGQAKTVPQIWAKSTKVLLSILGHSHETNVDCLSEDFSFDEPILNKSNFQTYYKIVINSVGECCILLKDENLEFKREKVIRCMSKSLFNLIIPAPESDRVKYFGVVTDILDNYIEKSKETPYYENLLVLIFMSLMEFDQDAIDDCVPLILKQLVIVFLTVDTGFDNITNDFKQVISHSFSKVILEENKVKMVETLLDCLVSLKTEDNNLPNFTKIWILLANELTIDFTTEKLTQFSKFDEFFIWPAQNMHHLESFNKKQMVLHWMKLYRKLTLESETKKLNIMKELEKNFKNNPLISSNITSLLSVVSQFDTKFSKEFVTKLMEVTSLVLQLPNLHTEDEQKLSSLVMQYFEPSLDCYNSENVDDMVSTVCTCIEHILSIHSGFKLIDPFVTFFKNCPISLQEKLSFRLKNCLLELYNKENDPMSYNVKEISKCLALFTEGNKEKEEKKSFAVPTGRSARIARMGKNSPSSPNKPSAKIASNLRIFGKDLETMSPLKVKGSQLNNTPVSKKKKIANVTEIQKKKNTRSINEENSSDFVPIHSEVQLQLNKLSEHQKEVFKKRRDDIPALYQDLSQSVSQDMFSSKSNSKEAMEQQVERVSVSLENNVDVVSIKSAPDILSSECDIFSETPKEITKSNDIIGDPEKSEGLNRKAEHTADSDGCLMQKQKFDDENKIEATISSDLFSNEICFKPSTENKKSTESSKVEELEYKSSETDKNKTSNELNKNEESMSETPEREKSGKASTSDKIEKSLSELTQPEASREYNKSDKIEEPTSAQKIEPVISNDLFSPIYSKKKSSGAQKEDEHPSEKKKRKELERLKMDIVGADKFFESPRRTREKKTVKQAEETPVKKGKSNKKAVKTVGGDAQQSSISVDRKLTEKSEVDNIAVNHINVDANSIAEENNVKLIEATVSDRTDINTKCSDELETLVTKTNTETKRSKRSKADKNNLKTKKVEGKITKGEDVDEDIEKNKSNLTKVREEDVKTGQANGKREKTEIKSKNSVKHVSKADNDMGRTLAKNAVRVNYANKNENKVTTPQPDLIAEGKDTNTGKKIGSKSKKCGADQPHVHKTRTSKIFKKLGSPLKRSPRIAIERQEKTVDHSNKLNDVGKSPKKLLIKLTEKNNTIFEAHKEVQDAAVIETHNIVGKNINEDPMVEETRNTANKIPTLANSSQEAVKEVNDEIETEAKGHKRKLSDDENEDIIESSQESFVEIIPLLNSSRKKQVRLSIEKACTTLENKVLEEINNKVEVENIPRKLDFAEADAVLMQNNASELTGKTGLVNDVKLFEEITEEFNSTQDTSVTPLGTSEGSVQTEDTVSKVSVITENTVIQPANEDVAAISPEPPKKPKLTVSDLIICQMDTMSACGSKDSIVTADKNVEEKLEPSLPLNSVEDILATSQTIETLHSSPDTPKKSHSIPSSPVTSDTPNRTNELLDNTVDISPITSRNNSEEEISTEIPVAKVLKFSIEEELQNMGEGDVEVNELGKEAVQGEQIDKPTSKEEKFEEETKLLNNLEGKDDTFEEDASSDEFDHVDASSEAEMTPLETSDIQNPTKSAPFPNFVPQIEHNEEPPIQNGQVSTTINIISNRALNEPSTIQERASKIQNFIHAMSHKPFMKRKGGTTSSPSALRIKKLMNNVGQKQHVQEVENFNENDILTFSREIPSPLAVPRSSILKRKYSDSSDGEGISPCPKRKRVNFSDPCLTSKKIFIKDDYQPSLEAKRLFDVNTDRKPSEEHLNDIFDFPDDTPSSELSTETDSDLIETEPSLAVVNPMVLQRSKPVFPKLIDCKEDALVIVKKITSPMFVPALMNKLKGKGVKTIGDLARLSEAEINRFPFKVPVVANVLKAFENYNRKKGDGDNRLEEKTDSSKEEEKRNGDMEMPKLDVKLELKMLIKRAVRAKVPTEDLANVVLSHIDPTKLTSIIKTHCPTIAVDALEEKDYISVLKIIVNKKGISEILKNTHVHCHNDEREHEFYDAIAEYVKYTVPLEKFFRGRSIEDLEVGIEESIKNDVFQKKQVLQHCLFPLLQEPKDIFPYLETLSMVQIDEIVINRIEEQDIGNFFERIIQARPLEDAKRFSENLWLKHIATPSEIVTSFEKNIKSQTEERRKDVLVEMFNFCSENLDANTLLELHVGFLRRISNAL